MAAFDFPASPSVNDTYTANGVTFTWNGVSWSSVPEVVYLNATQTLTNKTISVDNNTVSGIAASSFVLSNASGNVDGSAAQKAIPTGVVVGDSDSQTLTNKTINGSNNTITNVSLSTGVTSTLPIANGGTGQTTYTDGQILIGNTTGNTLTKATLTAGSGITVTNGSGSITISAPNALGGTVTSVSGTGTVNGITLTGTVTSSGNLTLGGTLSNVSLTTQVTGTLPVENGGTGATTLTGVVIGNGTSAFTVKTNPTGNFVGTTDSQTLTNKTISADNNTLSGIAASSFVLSNSSGNIDGAAAQKAIPAGVVVGTTDSQTLTNKTIDSANNTLTISGGVF